MAKKKIAIVGAGAVGGYAGAHMVQAGEDVTFIDPWPAHVEHMRKHGLRVTHAMTEPEFTVPVRALHVTDAQQLAKEKPVDIAFVCMKSYDTAWATMMIKQYLAPDGYVVSLQNCMNEETIAGIVGWGKTLGCIASSITVNLPEPGLIHRGAAKHGAAHTVFRAGEAHGRITPRAEEVCRLVAYADSAKVTNNLWGERWSKLVTNAMGNGLSACTGLGGGAMLKSEPIRRFSTRIGSEAIRVGQAHRLSARGDPASAARDHRARRRRRRRSDARLRRAALQGCGPHRGRAAPLDGPGHAEGPPHRDRIPQRPGGARGREARLAVPRQRDADGHRQARGARRAQARPEAHHRAAVELMPRPPFKADTVGSLLRPKRLLDARDEHKAGKLSDAALRQIEDDEIKQAVALHKECGFKHTTDGDFRRRHWFMDFIERIDGLRFGEPLAVRFKSADGSVSFSPPRMELYGRLRRTQSLTRTDFALLKPVADAAGLVAKECIPSPTLLHFRSTRSRMHSKVYPDVEQLYEDIAQVYREEIAALYAAGCRYLQIDETNIPGHLSDPTLRDGREKGGRGPRRAGACATPS